MNHEAWVIPYADLLTLLLALFVVLYAMSSINTNKYRALAQAISEGFNGSSSVIRPVQPAAAPAAAVRAPAPIISHKEVAAHPAHVSLPIQNQQNPPASKQADATMAPATTDEQHNLDLIRTQVERALQPLIDKKMVVIRRTNDWLEIEIRTDILFPSGVAALSPAANQVLTNIGHILAPFANPLRVEGYTDDKPINTSMYPSNWELSAARAASVARLFADHGVDPDRLGIVGWGQYHPLADNLNEDGRNRNRRVTVVVLSDSEAPTRFYSNHPRSDRVADARAAGAGLPAPSAVAAPAPALTRDALPTVLAAMSPDTGETGPTSVLSDTMAVPVAASSVPSPPSVVTSARGPAKTNASPNLAPHEPED